MGALKQGVKQARKINASDIKKQARQPFSMLVIGESEADRASLLRFLLPDSMEYRERNRALSMLNSDLPGGDLARHSHEHDLVLVTPWVAGVYMGKHGSAVSLNPMEPKTGIQELLKLYPQFRLALGRTFPVLRDAVAVHLIQATAMRNATFAGLSAIPELVPSPISLAWAVGEFASDTVVLTGNQIRLAFQLAALHGDEVGWTSQPFQLVSLLGLAFGWRALARELVSLVPGGVGLVAKAGIAYTGTIAAGQALLRYQARSVQTPSASVRQITIHAS